MRLSGNAARTSLMLGLFLSVAACEPALVSVADPPLVSVTPPSLALIVGQGQFVQVQVRNSRGEPVADSVTWSTSDAAVATVRPDGWIAGVGFGRANVIATAGDGADTVAVTVSPIVALGPDEPMILLPDTVHLSWLLRTQNGAPLAGAPVLTSRSAAVATVAPNGVVTGVAPGRTWIVATVEAAADSVEVVVLARSTSVGRDFSWISGGADYPGRVSLLSGANLDSLPNIDSVWAYAWSPDGFALVVWNNFSAQLSVVSTAGARRGLATGMYPQWCGDRIFLSDLYGRVAVVSAAGGTPALLTGPVVVNYAVSPDCRRIAYTRNDSLFFRSANPVNAATVAVPLPLEPRPPLHWSPDGRHVALMLVTSDVDWAEGVWMVRSDGRGLKPLTPNCTPAGLCSGPTNYTGGDWSPDGRRLALISYARSVNQFSNGPSSVLLVDTAGTVAGQFARGCCNLGALGPPQWSSDGQRLLFHDYGRSGEPSYLVVVHTDLAGNDRRVVAPVPNAPGQWSKHDFAWRP